MLMGTKFLLPPSPPPGGRSGPCGGSSWSAKWYSFLWVKFYFTSNLDKFARYWIFVLYSPCAVIYLRQREGIGMRLPALVAVCTAMFAAAPPEDVFQAIRNNHLAALEGTDPAVRDR